MKKTYRNLLLWASLLLPGLAYAQTGSNPKTEPEKKHVIYANKQQAEEELRAYLEPYWKVRSPLFRYSKTPTFNFVSPDNRFYLGIGGYVTVTGFFDFNNVVNNINLAPFAIQTNKAYREANGNDRARIGAYANLTTIDFRVVQKTGSGDIVGYLNMNFANGNNQGNFASYPQLWEAWISYHDFLLGYNFTTFTDVGAMPPTINWDGYNAEVEVQSMMVRYARELAGGKWKVGIAVELPQQLGVFNYQNQFNPGEVFNSNYTMAYGDAFGVGGAYQIMPDIPAYVQRNFGDEDEPSHIRLSGMIRNLAYRNTISNKVKSDTGWGIQLSGMQKAGDFQFYYNGIYGKGIGTYIEDLEGNNMDVVPTGISAGNLTSGRVKALEAWGAYAVLQYNISPKVFVTGGYSYVRAYPGREFTDLVMSNVPTPLPARTSSDDSSVLASYRDNYRFAYQIIGNVFWNILPNAQLGLEYNYGKRTNLAYEKGQASRLYMQMQYNF